MPARQAGDAFQAARIDHADAAAPLVAGVVADPQVAAVRLQGEAHRLAAGGDVGRHREAVGIDHRDLAGVRQGDVQALVLAVGHPVHRRALERDAAERAGDAADQDRRVDHRDARVLVEQQQVVAVQVDHRPGAHHALQVDADPRLAIEQPAVAAAQGLRLVHPGAGRHAAERLAAGGIGDAEADVGLGAFDELVAGTQRTRLEVDRHAVAHQALDAGDGLHGGRPGRHADPHRLALLGFQRSPQHEQQVARQDHHEHHQQHPVFAYGIHVSALRARIPALTRPATGPALAAGRASALTHCGGSSLTRSSPQMPPRLPKAA
ncbi:hypothetical protein D9M69_419200 [compost metagenome]